MTRGPQSSASETPLGSHTPSRSFELCGGAPRANWKRHRKQLRAFKENGVYNELRRGSPNSVPCRDARGDHPDFAHGALHASLYIGLRSHLLPPRPPSQTASSCWGAQAQGEAQVGREGGSGSPTLVTLIPPSPRSSFPTTRQPLP